MTYSVLNYYGRVTAGKLIIGSRKNFDNELKGLEGLEVEIRVKKYVRSRSSAQNRLYWLFLGIMADSLDYDKEELHEVVKFKFLKRSKVDEKSGEVFEYLGSTAKLNKEDFGKLIDQLTQWAAEMNIVLPQPGEQIGMI